MVPGNNKIAFIFPGQGSQFVGMAKDLYEDFDHVRQLFDTAHDTLGFDLAKICFEGPEEELKQTRVTQPAIFIHSVALFELFRSRDIQVDMAAGHSLGEYSALYAAEALTLEDGLRLVKLRAELMQQAGEVNKGTMAAIMGLDADRLNRVCEAASAEGVVQVANYNSPIQIVISGSVAGVEKAMQLAKDAGAKRVVPLVVGGAFHSPLMEHAHDGFRQGLLQANIRAATIPVYSNVTAKPVSQPDEIRELLLRQLTSPVRWVEIVENMVSDGAADFYEIGPGSVLTGLLKRINRDVNGYTINSTQSLESS